MFRLRPFSTGGRMIRSGNLSFAKRTSVGWMSASWTQKCCDHFGWRPLRLGVIILDEGLHDWGKRAMPLSNHTPAFAFQPKKNTENLSQGTRVVSRHYFLRRIGRLLRGTMTGMLSINPKVTDVRQPSVGTSAFLVAKVRSSPHQLTLSRNLPLMFWYGREEWNPQILVNLPVTNVPRCVNRNAKTPAALEYGCGQRTSRSDLHSPSCDRMSCL
jgi:hypothetical protein